MRLASIGVNIALLRKRDVMQECSGFRTVCERDLCQLNSINGCVFKRNHFLNALDNFL